MTNTPDLFNTPPTGVPDQVLNMFEKFALQVKTSGHDRYSARTICEVMRWRENIDKENREFLVNNNWIPDMARWFMKKHNCDGLFQTRER